MTNEKVYSKCVSLIHRDNIYIMHIWYTAASSSIHSSASHSKCLTGHGGGEMNLVDVGVLFCIGVDIVGFLDGE
jgi:hypothetical protein